VYCDLIGAYIITKCGEVILVCAPLKLGGGGFEPPDLPGFPGFAAHIHVGLTPSFPQLIERPEACIRAFAHTEYVSQLSSALKSNQLELLVESQSLVAFSWLR